MSYTFSTLSSTLGYMARAQLDSMTAPGVRAQRNLDEFVQRFDEASARLMRQNVQGWDCAFDQLRLGQDMGISRTDAARYVGSLLYGVAFDDSVLEPMRLWQIDWRRLLNEAAHMSEQDVDALARRHMGALCVSVLHPC